MSNENASAIMRIKGPRRRGVRLGNWLNVADAERLVHAPDTNTNKGKRVLKPAGHKLGFPGSDWHVFRHTHATLGEEIGMALSDRQAQMGHGDVRTTLHYTHSDLDRRRQSIEAMSDRLTEEPVTVAKLKGFDTK
jgi:integrase